MRLPHYEATDCRCQPYFQAQRHHTLLQSTLHPFTLALPVFARQTLRRCFCAPLRLFPIQVTNQARFGKAANKNKTHSLPALSSALRSARVETPRCISSALEGPDQNNRSRAAFFAEPLSLDGAPPALVCLECSLASCVPLTLEGVACPEPTKRRQPRITKPR